MDDPRIHELKALLPQCLLPDWVRLGSRLVRLLRDRRHEENHDALLSRLLEQARASVALREARRLNLPAIHYPPSLPITSRRDDIVAAIKAHQVVVLAGETGSGKTTQIPKMCLEAGLGIRARIGCTQPRRVAALSISRRIAEELDVKWGREVGCKIRFDDRSSPHTYIKLMTDGILLAETQGDPTLAEYEALIIDEAHERSLNIDFLLGYLKTLLARRDDLKLIVTSATIDTEAFSRHFDNAPIIEVSGRMFPVDVIYAPGGTWRPQPAQPPQNHAAGSPGSPASEEPDDGDIDYIDAAVRAAEQILYETDSGDVLIFMPGERDIRETGDQLEGRFSGEAEVIPLFGRLSAGDQQRVFAPSSRRKLIIATNIAETSLTIPGIRYVIDAGLARMSRYNPRTRTRRLPIEPVSQSSANQRKGRAGRVEDGICIRLYTEEDFHERPPFTQPEIQRSNLAEVILRMKAHQLGEIETFPFVQPPTPAAISSGYSLLQELGALDAHRELTPLGRDLARLPIDPTLGRMLLQSQHEHATRELLIIAAGLSIQDPRERPLDQKEAAAAVHKRFQDPQSDFLTLLNIWNSVHEQWEKLRTQGQRRRFCKQQFLSYLRLREWQDLHAQLHEALDGIATLKLDDSSASADAIHRSILAGLLGHVSRREERNTYKASGNRDVTIFPGSALYERGEPPRKPADRNARTAPAPRPRTHQPAWIMAGEVVETSQLFARTVAGIDPRWIVQIAPHACKVTHQNPHWSASAGRVLVEEVITLHGLEVERRKIGYGKLNPDEATRLFIRGALVEENLLPPPPARRGGNDANDWADDRAGITAVDARGIELPPQYQFLAHNRAVRQKIENWQTRVRRYDVGDLDQALADFYARHLRNVSSVHELNAAIREHSSPSFLCLQESDLVGDRAMHYDRDAFPDSIAVGGHPVALRYAYAPGEEHDGVTLRVPFTLAQSVSAAALEWSVPGLREEKIAELLRSLPKAIRKELMLFPPKVATIVGDFEPAGASFFEDLSRFVRQHFAVDVPVSAWGTESIPAHLRTRIEVIDHQERPMASGRNLDQLRQRLAAAPAKAGPSPESPLWLRVAEKWEQFAVTSWNFGDLPERVTVSEGPGIPVYGWPGLLVEEGNVNVRLCRTEAAAREGSAQGLRRLVEVAIQKDLAWVEKDLRALAKLEPLYASLGDGEELRASALEHVRHHVLPAEAALPLSRAGFAAAVETARGRLPSLAMQVIDRLGAILQLRQQIVQRLGNAAAPPAPRARTLTDLRQLGQPAAPAAPKLPSASPWSGELLALVPPRFPERIPFERLPHVLRYLKALQTRVERAALNPVKDQERARQLAPYVEALKKLEATPSPGPRFRRGFEELRWLVEEFKVSLFAQELGTAVPVSPKRLDLHLEKVRQTIG